MRVKAGVLRAISERQGEAMSKVFFLSAGQIQRDLAPNRGGCVATDAITVDGLGVGFMYREAGVNDLDSGWRFFAGTESREYLDELSHSGIYDVNTIANYSPDIIRWLDAPPGAAFARAKDGILKPRDNHSFPSEESEAL